MKAVKDGSKRYNKRFEAVITHAADQVHRIRQHLFQIEAIAQLVLIARTDKEYDLPAVADAIVDIARRSAEDIDYVDEFFNLLKGPVPNATLLKRAVRDATEAANG